MLCSRQDCVISQQPCPRPNQQRVKHDFRVWSSHTTCNIIDSASGCRPSYTSQSICTSLFFPRDRYVLLLRLLSASTQGPPLRRPRLSCISLPPRRKSIAWYERLYSHGSFTPFRSSSNLPIGFFIHVPPRDETIIDFLLLSFGAPHDCDVS